MILVCGHLCIDLIPGMAKLSVEAMTTPGKLNEVGPMSSALGGVVGNTGLALFQLGTDVRLMAAVGDDLIGRLTLEQISQLDPRLIEHLRVKRRYPGAYTIVLSPQQRDRTFLSCLGASGTFGLDDIDFEVVAQAKIVHLGYPSLLPRLYANDGAELAAIFRRIKQAEVMTSLDFTLPDASSPAGGVNWRKILARTLPFVDIFLPSIAEIRFMLGYDPGLPINHAYLSDLADELTAMGAGIVGFKLGELGLYLKYGEDQLYHPAFLVDVAGTTGAGDAAYAGFLTAWLKGYSPAECVRWACAVGACKVEARGVLTWDETAARMAAGWALRSERLL